MRKNILISTTRQWNPGDEFIMNGALNIIETIMGDQFNPIIFNRNPDIRGGASFRNCSRNLGFTNKWDNASFKGKGGLQELLRIGHYDNSWKDDMNSGNIDFALFAGSPEWYSTRLRPMYQAIEQSNLPVLFLGIGAGDNRDFQEADPAVRRVLSRAKLITVRDHITEQLLHDYGAVYLPCPALLSAKKNRVVKEVQKIGLIYTTDKTVKGHCVSTEMHDYLLKLYPELIKRYQCAIVCHYIDELDQASLEFPDTDIFYSYDSKDYERIFNNFDLVIGGRVHGIGISASLGIPGIMIKHDSRSSTTDGFCAESISINTEVQKVVELVEKYQSNIETYSKRLVAHKQAVMDQYVQLLQEKAGDLFSTQRMSMENTNR